MFLIEIPPTLKESFRSQPKNIHSIRLALAALEIWDKVLVPIDKESQLPGSGCGSVGRAVTFNTRGLRFESSHRQNLYWTFVCLFTINCIEKTKINKRGREWPTFKRKSAAISRKYVLIKLKTFQFYLFTFYRYYSPWHSIA